MRVSILLWRIYFLNAAGIRPTAASAAVFLNHPFPTKKKTDVPAVHRFSWWERVDSNHRSQRQQIYSLPPLATRERSHI